MRDALVPTRWPVGRAFDPKDGVLAAKIAALDQIQFVRGMRRICVAALPLLLLSTAATSQELTCEQVTPNLRRCFDQHGYESTEERDGDYVHGHDSLGNRWTSWDHNGRTTTWPNK